MSATATAPSSATAQLAPYLGEAGDLVVMTEDDDRKLYYTRKSLQAIGDLFLSIKQNNLDLDTEGMACLMLTLQNNMQSVTTVSYKQVLETRNALLAKPQPTTNRSKKGARHV